MSRKKKVRLSDSEPDEHSSSFTRPSPFFLREAARRGNGPGIARKNVGRLAMTFIHPVIELLQGLWEAAVEMAPAWVLAGGRR